MPTDRDYERAFVLRNLPPPPATLLDVGPGGQGGLNYLLGRGYTVYAIDIQPYTTYSGCTFVQGDIRKTDFPDEFFDVVTSVSTLEHVGLAGRYGVTEWDLEGDKKSMAETRRILKPGGILLLTTTFGVRETCGCQYKVYDEEQICELTWGFRVEAEYYCTEDDYILPHWHPCTKEEAAVKQQYHALVCLKLTCGQY